LQQGARDSRPLADPGTDFAVEQGGPALAAFEKAVYAASSQTISIPALSCPSRPFITRVPKLLAHWAHWLATFFY
jgi:hypothetical protein